MDPHSQTPSTQQQRVAALTVHTRTPYITGAAGSQLHVNAVRRSSISMDEGVEGRLGSAENPRTEDQSDGTPLTAAELRKQKRFTLTLPITANVNAHNVPRLSSPTRSVAPSLAASEDETRPTTPSDTNFLTALAAQERRVLELREELAKAEQALHKLKKEWAIQEVQKKRQDIRRMRSTRHSTRNSAAASVKSEESDVQSDLATRDAERRRAMHYQARTWQRKIFSGSRHTRTLSLLSPDLSTDNISSASFKGASQSDQWSYGLPAGVEDAAPPARPSQRVVSGEVQRSRSYHANGKDLDMPREVLIRAGRQIASDFKDGLWTFLEDLRQVTVGDEAAADSRARPTRPDVNVTLPRSKVSKSEKRMTASSQQSPGRVTKAKRTPQAVRTSRSASSGPTEEGHDADKTLHHKDEHVLVPGLENVHVSASPVSRRGHGRRAGPHDTTHRNSIDIAEDVDAWDQWDSPQPQTPKGNKSPVAIRQDEGVSFANKSNSEHVLKGSLFDRAADTEHLDEPKDLLSSSLDENGKREPIPWPTLVKLTPSNLRRTASHLMNEWEKSLSPMPEVKQMDDYYLDAKAAVAVSNKTD